MWLDVLDRIGGLECSGGHCPDRSKCDTRGGMYLGHDFPSCPVRMMLDDVHLQAAMSIERAVAISPITGWPDGFSAWVVELSSMLKAARADRRQSEMDNARRR